VAGGGALGFGYCVCLCSVGLLAGVCCGVVAGWFGGAVRAFEQKLRQLGRSLAGVDCY